MPQGPDYALLSKKAALIAGVILAIAAAALLLWWLVDVVLLVFAAVLLAVLLRGLADPLARHSPLSSGWALAIVWLAILAILGGALWYMGPKLASQFGQLTENLPESLRRTRESIAQMPFGGTVADYIPTMEEIRSGKLSFLPGFRRLFSRGLDALVYIAFVIGVGTYIAAARDVYLGGALRLLPIESRDRGREVLTRIGSTLRWWLVGRFSSMAVIGILKIIGLWLLGVPLPVVLGIIAMAFTFIPNIGPILAFIPAGLIAMLIGPQMVVWVLLLDIGIQGVESYLITPMIQKKAVSLPPALTITAQLCFTFLLGILGLALATPATAALLVAVRMLYVQDTLGDPIEPLVNR